MKSMVHDRKAAVEAQLTDCWSTAQRSCYCSWRYSSGGLHCRGGGVENIEGYGRTSPRLKKKQVSLTLCDNKTNTNSKDAINPPVDSEINWGREVK